MTRLIALRDGQHTLELANRPGKPLTFPVFRLVDKKTKKTILTKAADSEDEVYLMLPNGRSDLVTKTAEEQPVTKPLDLPRGVPIKHIKIRLN